MTYLPQCVTSAMPSQTTFDRVPPHHPHTVVDADRWAKCIDLNSLSGDDLPLDPRNWGRDEVAVWVERSGGLPERFPMNGKALCLMTKEMFCNRVPNHGHRLHHDFRRRLARALALQEIVEKMTVNK